MTTIATGLSAQNLPLVDMEYSCYSKNHLTVVLVMAMADILCQAFDRPVLLDHRNGYYAVDVVKSVCLLLHIFVCLFR